MILHQLTIDGFKCFETAFTVEFASGLNVLVGENGTGKSAIVDAIRTILQEDEFGRAGIRDTDFHRPFSKKGKPVSNKVKPAEQIVISACFRDLLPDEQVAFFLGLKAMKPNLLCVSRTNNLQEVVSSG